MTRVHVERVHWKPNYFALVDSDTGKTITFGSQAEIDLRAQRVTEIHDRHERDHLAAEVQATTDELER